MAYKMPRNEITNTIPEIPCLISLLIQRPHNRIQLEDIKNWHQGCAEVRAHRDEMRKIDHLFSLYRQSDSASHSLFRTIEGIEYCWLFSDNPTIVSRWNVYYIARTELDLLTVISLGTHPTRDNDSKVMHLATICFCDRLHVLGPSPTWLVHLLHYDYIPNLDGSAFICGGLWVSSGLLKFFFIRVIFIN